jgi:hypothetical protein
VARLAAERGLGDLVAAREDGNPFVPLAVTAATAGVGVVVIGVAVAAGSAALALAGLAVVGAGVILCGWQVMGAVTYTSEYLYASGPVRQRRLKLEALAWPEVREVLAWVGELFMPGQVIALYVVSTAGRKMRVESSTPRGAIGEQVVAAARAQGIPAVETTDSPEPLWAL